RGPRLEDDSFVLEAQDRNARHAHEGSRGGPQGRGEAYSVSIMGSTEANCRQIPCRRPRIAAQWPQNAMEPPRIFPASCEIGGNFARTSEKGKTPAQTMTNARSPAPFYFSGVAFFIPFALSILFADQAAGFLDEGEFVAQARSLGISHPPGQPLPGLLFALASLIPAGSIAFRVAIL